MRHPLAPDDPVHVLGKKIAVVVEASDVETCSNALLVNLHVAVMNMDERQVRAFEASMPAFVTEVLAARLRWRASLHPAAHT